MTHRRDESSGAWRRAVWRLFTWSNGVRLLGAGGLIMLIRAPDERVLSMVICAALATFGLPGAIKLDRLGQREKDDV